MRRALVGSAVLLLTAGFAAAAQDRWLHVKVVDAAKGGESVNVNIPLELAEKVLPTIQAEKLSHGKIKIEGEIERSEEHTSELQSRPHLVCRLLLEKKKKRNVQEPIGYSVTTKQVQVEYFPQSLQFLS